MYREAFGEVIEIIIGSSKTKFIAIKQVICARSKFVETACSERWESGRTGTITLEDQDPAIFSIWMSWLWFGSIDNAASLIDLNPTDKSQKEQPQLDQWEQLAECYVLGDFLQAPEFCNAIMDSMLKNAEYYSREFRKLSGTDRQDIEYIWTNTVAGSPLRRLVLDNAADFQANMDNLKDSPPSYGLQQYFFDLASLVTSNRVQQVTALKPWKKDICATYHHHPGKPEGYACI